MQAEKEGRETISDLGKIYVRSSAGGLVTLSSLVTVKEIAGPRELNRYNKLRAITLQGGVAPGYSLGQALEFLEQQARAAPEVARSEEHTSDLQSLMRISYAVFCLK